MSFRDSTCWVWYCKTSLSRNSLFANPRLLVHRFLKLGLNSIYTQVIPTGGGCASLSTPSCLGLCYPLQTNGQLGAKTNPILVQPLSLIQRGDAQSRSAYLCTTVLVANKHGNELKLLAKLPADVLNYYTQLRLYYELARTIKLRIG